MCGACSATINVNDALPQIEVSVVAAPTISGVVGVGANYTYNVSVENVSLGVPNMTVVSVQSSTDGVITACPVGVLITDIAPYSCT